MAIQILSSYPPSKMMTRRTPHSRGASPIEMLPSELLSKVLLYTTFPANKPTSRVGMPKNINVKVPKEYLTLVSTLLTSKTFYEVAIAVAYRAPRFQSTSTFEAFTQQIINKPELGRLVRRLDFSSLIASREASLWPTCKNRLQQLLVRTPLLRELVIGQNLGNEVDESVLRLILCDLQHLETLQFDACNSGILLQSFTALDGETISNSISNLSLRKCNLLSEKPFQWLLSSLPRLRSLDVSHTWVPTDALMSIPKMARVEHLDLSFCYDLSGPQVATFLSSHPAVTSSLISLNLNQLPEEPYLDIDDISIILANLPGTMKSLNLRNAAIIPDHLPSLQKLHSLEYLSAGSSMDLRDLEQLILSPVYEFPASDADQSWELFEGVKPKYTPVLGPLGIAIPVCKLRRRLNSITPHRKGSNTMEGSKLRHLDISAMSCSEQFKIMNSVLLANCSRPLEVIEISCLAMRWKDGLIGDVVEGAKWKARNVGKRHWLERA